MAVAGRVAIVPKGEWNAQTAYKRLDAVTHNNTLYFAKKDVSAGTATTNTEYWSKSISGSVVNVATDTEDGLMPKEDKKKLDGIDGDVAAKLGESKDGSLTYNGTEIKPSVETGQGLSIGEDGKLQVNIDGTTLTMDQVNNVIKLADTLKDAINGAFPAANVVNNQITTAEGYALDARQANPNIDGSLAKQISDLNGRLKNVATKNDINALNPSGAIRLYSEKAIGKEGAGWYRFAKITCKSDTAAKGSSYILIETLIRQSFSNALGCFHKIDFYLIYNDSARISVTGYNSSVLKKVRIVRNGNIIFLDVYSVAIINATEILSFIPFNPEIQSAEHVEIHLVPETADGEVIVRSDELADNI
jgi:hypothetical protein